MKERQNKVMGAAHFGSLVRDVSPKEAYLSRSGGGFPSKGNSKCKGPREASSSLVIISTGRPLCLKLSFELSQGQGAYGLVGHG